MSNPNLYALFVGINKYKNLPAMRWLQYCHSDVALMKSYLEESFVQSAFGKVDLTVMTEVEGESKPDLMPTKDNVIKAFRSHLGQAKPGDTVIFYFSGHGVREKTEVNSFKGEELDGNIGGLVMHNFGDRSISNPGATVLADKEIRFLLKELADKGTKENPIHTLVMFDCCHSGESTRAVLSEELPAKSRQIERGPLGSRSIEEFFFCSDATIKQQLESGKSLDQVLPEGEHVMLAACREVELAWEGAGGNGAFTRGLVDVLRKHQGDISYHELHSRVVNRMRFVELDDDANDYRQTPQFYLNTPRLSDRYRKFLTNKPSEQPTYGALEFNAAEDEWRLDIGALHGVPVDPASPTKVKVYPAGKPDQAKSAEIKNVFPTHSTLDLFGFTPDSSQSWRGELQGVALPKLRIAITGDQDGVDLATRVISKRIADTATPTLELVPASDEPDYELQAANGILQIYEPGKKPLARVMGSPYLLSGQPSDDAAEVQYEYLTHIARWTMMKDLNHNGEFEADDPAFAHPSYPVEFRVYEYDPQTQQETRVATQKNGIIVDLTEQVPVKYVRFELINRTPKELFVSLVYMPHTFGFLTKGKIQLMHKAQLGLGPMVQPAMEAGEGHVQSSRMGKKMPNGQTYYMAFRSGGYVETDNWPGMQEYLKLMVSEAPFEIESLHLDMLPVPGAERSETRFMAIDIADEKPIPKWELTTISLYITNPKYQPDLVMA